MTIDSHVGPAQPVIRSPVAPSTVGASWEVSADGMELRLRVAGVCRAILTRWSDNGTGAHAWWGVEIDGQEKAIHEHLADAASLAAKSIGVIAPLPGTLLDEWPGSRMSASADAPSSPETVDAGDLVDRLGKMLAEIVDATLMTVRDPDGRDVEIRLGGFRPDLGERACELLEETGF